MCFQFHFKRSASAILFVFAGTMFINCSGSDDSDNSLLLAPLLLAGASGPDTGESGSDSGESDQCAGKSWNHPSGLGEHITAAGAGSENADVALSSSGYGVVSYMRDNSEVRIREYNSGAWGGPVSIKSAITIWDKPDVAVNESGDAIIGFIDDDVQELSFATRKSGSWSSTANYAPFGAVCGITGPAVTIDDSGNALMAFESDNNLYRSEYRGGTWSHPGSTGDAISSGSVASSVSVAGNSSGIFAISWVKFVSDYQTFVSIRNGSWDDPASTADNLSPDGQSVETQSESIAIDDSGNIIVVWSQSDGSHRRIYKAEYSNGSWSLPSGLSDAISPGGTNADNPVVAMGNNGSAMIAWTQSDGTNNRILLSVKVNGAWSHPSSAGSGISSSGSNASWPEVAMNPDGKGVVTWQQQIGGKDRLHMIHNFSSSFSDDQNSIDVISPVGTDALNQSIAIDNSCNATIVWEQSNGTNTQIFMSEYR